MRGSIIGLMKASRIPNLVILSLAQILSILSILKESILEINTILVVISTAIIAAAGYIINDYYDQKIDMINRPDKVVVGVSLKRRRALFLHSLFNFTAVAIGFFIDPLIGLIHIFSATILWLYSNQLRRLPLIGNLAIASLSGMSFLILSAHFRTTHQALLIYAFFAFLMVLIREIIKDIEDVKGEAAFGCVTVPVVWGIRGAKIIIYLVTAAGAGLLVSFLTTDMSWILRGYFFALTPFFIWFIFRVYKADTKAHFAFLHQLCNYIILTGILSILFN